MGKRADINLFDLSRLKLGPLSVNHDFLRRAADFAVRGGLFKYLC